MSNCNEFYTRLVLYLDNELDQIEKLAVEAHVGDCQACQQVLVRERWFKAYVANAKPLYKAPENLRTRVASIVSAAPVTPRVHPLVAAREMLFDHDSGLHGGASRKILAAASILLILSGIWIAMVMFNPSESTTFAAVAVDTHQRYQKGRLPLELTTHSSEQITNWFRGKTPFTLELPNYSDDSNQNELYRIEGARLVAFENDYAAYVSYLMGERLISLLVASSNVAQPSGAEKIPSKNLIFHYDTIDELKVITWSHRGLTYALVSDLEERGQQSCLVCHQNMNLQLGENFGPRNW